MTDATRQLQRGRCQPMMPVLNRRLAKPRDPRVTNALLCLSLLIVTMMMTTITQSSIMSEQPDPTVGPASVHKLSEWTLIDDGKRLQLILTDNNGESFPYRNLSPSSSHNASTLPLVTSSSSLSQQSTSQHELIASTLLSNKSTPLYKAWLRNWVIRLIRRRTLLRTLKTYDVSLVTTSKS